MGFDPYRDWLQIPDDRRPPTYYDLLGVSPEEADPECIRDAAASRYEHIRKYTLGPHGEDAQRLLNELSQAVSCLCSLQRRAVYDRSLGDPQPPPIQSPRPEPSRPAVEIAMRPLPEPPGPPWSRRLRDFAAAYWLSLVAWPCILLIVATAISSGRPSESPIEPQAAAATAIPPQSEAKAAMPSSPRVDVPKPAEPPAIDLESLKEQWAEIERLLQETLDAAPAASASPVSTQPAPSEAAAPAAPPEAAEARSVRLVRQPLRELSAEITFELPRRPQRDWALGEGTLFFETSAFEFGQGGEHSPAKRSHSVRKLAQRLSLRSVDVELQVEVNGVFVTVHGKPHGNDPEQLARLQQELTVKSDRLQSLQAGLEELRSASGRDRRAGRERIAGVLTPRAAPPRYPVQQFVEQFDRPFGPPWAHEGPFDLPPQSYWSHQWEASQRRAAERAPRQISEDEAMRAATAEIGKLGIETRQLRAAMQGAQRRVQQSQSQLDQLSLGCREITLLVYPADGPLQ